MTMLNCAILDDYQDAALGAADWTKLPEGVRVQRFAEGFDDLETRAAALGDYEIIVAMRERTVFDEALLERLPKLKLLITTGMRNASIDMAAAKARGVTVCGTRNSIGPAAELAWGLLLALKRNIPAEVANFRSGGIALADHGGRRSQAEGARRGRPRQARAVGGALRQGLRHGGARLVEEQFARTLRGARDRDWPSGRGWSQPLCGATGVGFRANS